MRRDEEIGNPFFAGKREIAVMEQNEEHTHQFANNDNARRHAEQDDAETFNEDFHRLIKDMKPQAGGDMIAFVAVMNFVKTP